MAPLKVIVIICGTWTGSIPPGIRVPSGEQKQSGSWHWLKSQSGDLLGSWSTVQAFSSEPSGQSALSSQKSSLSMQSPLPHWSCLSGQTGSSVFRLGRALRGSVREQKRNRNLVTRLRFANLYYNSISLLAKFFIRKSYRPTCSYCRLIQPDRLRTGQKSRMELLLQQRSQLSP